MKFCEQKALEVAAFFLKKCDSSLEIKKLMKLMYLAERCSVEDYGDLLVGDNPVSLEQGPVLTRTYDMAKPSVKAELWDAHISRDGIWVNLDEEVENRYLSSADYQVLEKTWVKFGHLNPQQLTDYTHDNCPEWTDPGRSSLPIQYWEFAQAVGHNQEAASIIDRRIIEQRKLSISIDKYERDLVEA